MINTLDKLRFFHVYILILLCSFASNSFAVIHVISNSNFTMLDPVGIWIPSSDDVYGTFDDAKLCSDVACTLVDGMTLASNTPFFGIPWIAHDIRVFTQGTYTFDTNCSGDDIASGITDCGGEPLTLRVGPNQLGAHILFNWNVNEDIDVVVVWNINDTFPYPTASDMYNLASTDGNGDGIPGIPMVEYPFPGFNINFNLNMDPPFDLSGVSVAIEVTGGDTQECTEIGGSVVYMTAEYTLYGGEVLESIEWFVDGDAAGTGESISPFLNLGQHAIEVIATTTSGATSSNSVTVDVTDTVAPSINLKFLDTRTSTEITTISKNKMSFVTASYSATDVCDLNPQTAGSVTAFDVESEDIITVLGRHNSIQLMTTSLALRVTATDASGNASDEQTTLSVSD
ncbi:MAG: hypothetical protein EP297_00395 [Gammaproteobacteria bacterium]|nr:MAG: hypothetical protein EP297_00395 [Gammaproteobacteria bacterium]